MKQLIIVAAGLILVGCGSPYTYRSGKIRKFKVDKSGNEKEQAVDNQSTRNQRKYELVLAETNENSQVYEEESTPQEEAKNEVYENLQADRSELEVSSLDDATHVRAKQDKSAAQGGLTHRDQRSERKAIKPDPGKRKYTKRWIWIDWEEVGFWSLILALATALVLGFVYVPALTALILTALVVAGIVAICVGLLLLIGELFDLFLISI